MPNKKTAADPTGQRGNRTRTTKRLQRRLISAKRKVTALFHKIPFQSRTVKVNADLVYRYDMTPEQKEAFQAEVRRIVALEVLGTQQADRVPPEWWFKPELELPVRQGYSEEVIQFNQLIKVANVKGLTGRNGMPAQIIPVELALTSNDYSQQLNSAYLDGFNNIKTLSDKTADEVIRAVGAGIQAGNSPTEIASAITERFDVAASNAKRIAVTEVNKAYNDARLNATDAAADQTGLTAGIIHISALLRTTRRTHAARHGNFYTTREELAWWNKDANRINCHCTTKPALLDGDGNVIVTGPA